jgi:gliding motility-associated-like protein
LDSHSFSSPGRYVVTAWVWYTDKGAVVKDTLVDTVDVIAAPQITLGPDTTVCHLDSIEVKITNGVTVYEILWHDSTKRKFHRVDSASTLWVTVSNRCGVGRDTIKIDSLFSREVDLGPDTVLCVGDTIRMWASDTGATYRWQDSSTQESYLVDTGGVYWVEVRNMCGSKRDTIEVFDERPPSIDIGPRDTALCKGTNMWLIALYSRSTYRWQNGAPGAGQAVLYPGGRYWVEVTNMCGVDSDTMEVYYHEPVTLNLGNDTILCAGDSIIKSPKLGAGRYQWQDNSTDSAYVIKTGGKYWLEFNNACSTVSDTLQVSDKQKVEVNLGKDTTVCNNVVLTLKAAYSGASYQWSTGATTPNIQQGASGKTWVGVSNECGTERDTIEINHEAPLSPDLGPDTILCDARYFKLHLNMPAGTKYSWSTGDFGEEIEIRQAGEVRVTVSNVCGSYTARKSIEQQYTPHPQLASDTTLCEGTSLVLSTGMTPTELSGITVEWDNGTNRESRGIGQSGLYWVRLENRCGRGSDSIRVKYNPNPTLVIGDTILCLGEELSYDYSTRDGWRMYWQDGSESSVYTVREPGEYSVEIEDANGCFGGTSFEVELCPGEFWAPNAFSPNRDAKNEIWRAHKADIYDYQLSIYNRWNEVVFESSDINEGWDGNRGSDGGECPVGNYVYKVTFKELHNHQTQVFTGEIYLIR